jgi:transposase
LVPKETTANLHPTVVLQQMSRSSASRTRLERSRLPTEQHLDAEDDLPALARAHLPRRGRPRGRGKRLVLPADKPEPVSPQQRLLLLDLWPMSGVPAGDFAALVGVSKHTLYAWKKHFDSQGPAGLLDQPRGGPQGSRLSDLTKRAILMLKQSKPDWGCQKISDLLLRGQAKHAGFACPRRAPVYFCRIETISTTLISRSLIVL